MFLGMMRTSLSTARLMVVEYLLVVLESIAYQIKVPEELDREFYVYGHNNRIPPPQY